MTLLEYALQFFDDEIARHRADVGRLIHQRAELVAAAEAEDRRRLAALSTCHPHELQLDPADPLQ